MQRIHGWVFVGALCALVGYTHWQMRPPRPGKPTRCGFPIAIETRRRGRWIHCATRKVVQLREVLEAELPGQCEGVLEEEDLPVRAGQSLYLTDECHPIIGRLRPRERLLLGRCLDINGASSSDFAMLPRIGPSLAKRIVAFREKRGRFNRVTDLGDVRGIGANLLGRLTPELCVEPAE